MNRITLCPTGEWRLYAYDDQPGGAAGFLLERFALDIETRVRAATGLTETAVGLTEGGSRDLTIRTRKGLAWAGLSQVEPARIGVSTVRHWATCARLAVVLDRGARCGCGASRGSGWRSERRWRRWRAPSSASRGWAMAAAPAGSRAVSP